MTTTKEKRMKNAETLKGIEQALWIICLTLIWKPLGILLFIWIIWKEQQKK